MAEPVDLSMGVEEQTPADTKPNGSASETATSNEAPSTNDKRMGQLTFDDFESIKRVQDAPDMSSHATGLRRSKRVPQQRMKRDVADIMEEEAEAEAARKKRAQASAKAKARARERERERAKAKSAASKKLEGSASVGKKTANSIPASTTHENQEPPLTNNNWSPNMPLLSSDFKTHHSIISRLKNPNMKPVYYTGDVMKVMGFINKFYYFFDAELLNLSFQTFEVGLDLYPGGPVGEVVGIFDEAKQRTLLYQDYLPIKDVVSSQDKMNLLFLTLLKLTFSTSKAGELQRTHRPLISLNQMKSQKKPFTMLVRQLRSGARSWGYPKEWRTALVSEEEFLRPKFKLFENDESDDPVDSKMPEILTPNIYEWHRHELLPLEEDPLQTAELEKDGILALKPRDRIILLRAMVDWCGSQSPKIRNEIYSLSHTKRDPAFGVQTQHAPRYLVEGSAVTYAQFRKLCSIIQSRYEIRSKKKHVKKQLSNGKKEDLSIKLKILEEIKQTLNGLNKEEKDQEIVSLYDKWAKLFDGELPDNPLGNPFEDEVYKLRQQEFFVGRVPHIGDFYLPRLHTYPNGDTIGTFFDLRHLKSLHEKYASGEIDAFTLFEQNGQTMSCQFKLFYHDTISLIRDTAQGNFNMDKTYWYEMCHDTKTLKEFLEFLDYKITAGDTSQQATSHDQEQQPSGEVSHSEVLQHEPVKDEKGSANTKLHDSKSGATSTINKNPLPKEARFNPSRNKLRFLKEYLAEMYDILRVFEELKEQYGDTKPSQRLLRRSQRRNVSYGYGSDAEEADVDMGEEYVDEDKNEGEDYEEEDEPLEDREDEEEEEDDDDENSGNRKNPRGRTSRQARSARRNTRRR
ncbi:IOC3 (YFR013W) and ESC8 (YOL017W) [Zygosaccharomyces parabailii]|nr:IOC3 (YFR013W) and ESC8 (YOL017W) [Zygosaccharomyces parabailii]CDH11680.1 related to ISWI one complex protein 3 [Zygosaccharomyces bailii ISA1307]